MALPRFANVLCAVVLISFGMAVSSPRLAAETNPHAMIGVTAGVCQSCHASIGSGPQSDARWQRAASQGPRAFYASYEGATIRRVPIDVATASGRVLDLLIEPGAATTTQLGVLARVGQYATSRGITLNVVPIP